MYLPRHSFAPYVVALFALSLGACSSTPEKQGDAGSTSQQVIPQKQAGEFRAKLTKPTLSAMVVRALAIIQQAHWVGILRVMHVCRTSSKIWCKPKGLTAIICMVCFPRCSNRDDVARLWANSSNDPGSPKGWYAYRDRFVTAANIQRGSEFWRQNAAHLQRAATALRGSGGIHCGDHGDRNPLGAHPWEAQGD